IHQILGNLISNAAKYGTLGAEIQVEIRPVDAFVEVAVINQGELPAKDRPQLFSRFTRSRQARASKTPGVGLGLYISRGLVEAHGGRIWVDSANGTTAFRFTLPRPPES